MPDFTVKTLNDENHSGSFVLWVAGFSATTKLLRAGFRAWVDPLGLRAAISL